MVLCCKVKATPRKRRVGYLTGEPGGNRRKSGNRQTGCSVFVALNACKAFPLRNSPQKGIVRHFSRIWRISALYAYKKRVSNNFEFMQTLFKTAGAIGQKNCAKGCILGAFPHIPPVLRAPKMAFFIAKCRQQKGPLGAFLLPANS